MADSGHYFSSDLQLSATGGLLPVDSVLESQQRILRRLMTNQGDYIWEPNYGAGLPRRIGSTLDVTEMTALIRSQMYLEDSVQQIPEPQITVLPIVNGIYISISYIEADSGKPATLSFDVTP